MSQPGELVPFVAASVEDAVTQVRARLGPSAVVVHVRKVPVRARGWFRKSTHRLEILAYRPETGGAIDCVSDAPAGPVMAPGASDSRSPAAVQSDSSHPPHAAETAASSPRVEEDATVGRSPGTTRSAGAWRA